MRVLNHQADAIDCYQDVFLEVFQKPDRDKIENPGAYLRWLATRRAIDALRKRRTRQNSICPADPASVSVAETPQENVEYAELLAVVRSELAALPAAQAQAFWLVSVEQCSYEEVATLLETERNHVGVLIHRARRHLQQRLKQLAPHRQP